MTLGEALRAARSRRGLSIRETSERLNVYRETYRRWERDQQQPFAQELPSILTVLGLQTKVASDGRVSPA